MRPRAGSLSRFLQPPHPQRLLLAPSCIWWGVGGGGAAACEACSHAKVFGVDWVSGGSCSQYGFSLFPSSTYTTTFWPADGPLQM